MPQDAAAGHAGAEVVMTRQAVTGAFGFLGRHIAAQLLDRGDEVVTLTNRAPRSVAGPGTVLARAFAGRVPGEVAEVAGRPGLSIAPLVFDRDGLAASLRDVDTLFNTYWIRFDRGHVTHAAAVSNSAVLFEAARLAGVRRIVHVSIANPDPTSRLSYYRGKAEIEAALAESGVSYGVLRPTVLFGDEPILANNVAWFMRRLPVFGIAGSGHYGIQPVHVDDVAAIALDVAARNENVTVDAAGPEIFEYREWIGAIRQAVRSRTLILHLPSALTMLAARTLGIALRDVVLTRDELDALTAGLLVSHTEPLGKTSFRGWLADAAPWLGRVYLSELRRNYSHR
jgi:uncharacterized protein YbjT (DUF2867 family)